MTRRQTVGRPLPCPQGHGGGKSGLHGNTVPVNGRRGRPQGQCHRKQTACAPPVQAGSPQARVKRCGKSAPPLRQRRGQGKPHREQDRIGVTGGMSHESVTCDARAFPPRHPGWSREARSDARPRGMAVQGLREQFRTEPGLQTVWHSYRRSMLKCWEILSRQFSGQIGIVRTNNEHNLSGTALTAPGAQLRTACF